MSHIKENSVNYVLIYKRPRKGNINKQWQWKNNNNNNVFYFFFLSKEEIIKEREGISQIILGFKLFLKDKFT